ncbi:MAG TPA: hypothetical protein PLZ57_14530 [Pseudobdellovibrionaceae bacterium]|nr:hypothetical protein [Pseudobdellovibrionaceae bacterium]
MRAEATPFPMLRSPHATIASQDSRITRTHASRGLTQISGSTRSIRSSHSGRELSLLHHGWGSQAETSQRGVRASSRQASERWGSSQSSAAPRWTLAIFIIPLASTITFYALQYLSRAL